MPTYLYTFACGFSSTPISPFTYHWEVDSSNTYHNCWGMLLRENPSQKPWELEIAMPIYLYIFACGFSSTLTSPFPYHGEVDSPNTYHTLLECQVRIWCCWEALVEAKDSRCNMELVAGSGELDKTRFWVVLLE